MDKLAATNWLRLDRGGCCTNLKESEKSVPPSRDFFRGKFRAVSLSPVISVEMRQGFSKFQVNYKNSCVVVLDHIFLFKLSTYTLEDTFLDLWLIASKW